MKPSRTQRQARQRWMLVAAAAIAAVGVVMFGRFHDEAAMAQQRQDRSLTWMSAEAKPSSQP